MTLLKVTLQSAAEDCLILLDDYCLPTLCNSSIQKTTVTTEHQSSLFVTVCCSNYHKVQTILPSDCGSQQCRYYLHSGYIPFQFFKQQCLSKHCGILLQKNKTKNNHIDKVHCKIPYFSSVTTPSAKLSLSFTMETNYQL